MEIEEIVKLRLFASLACHYFKVQHLDVLSGPHFAIRWAVYQHSF